MCSKINRIFGYIDKGFPPIDPIYRGFTVFTSALCEAHAFSDLSLACLLGESFPQFFRFLSSSSHFLFLLLSFWTVEGEVFDFLPVVCVWGLVFCRYYFLLDTPCDLGFRSFLNFSTYDIELFHFQSWFFDWKMLMNQWRQKTSKKIFFFIILWYLGVK